MVEYLHILELFLFYGKYYFRLASVGTPLKKADKYFQIWKYSMRSNQLLYFAQTNKMYLRWSLSAFLDHSFMQLRVCVHQ